MEHIRPPWDDETVSLLLKYQQNEEVHPCTCKTAGCKRRYGWELSSTILLPTKEGFVCPMCGMEQKWVPSVVLEMARTL